MKIEKQSMYYEKMSIEKRLSMDKEIKKNKARRLVIWICLGIFISISLLNIVSASFYSATYSYRGGSSFQFLIKHFIWFVVAIVTFGITNKIPYTFYKKKPTIRFALIISILLLLAVLIGAKIAPKLVPVINGAIGWIRLGPFSIQPAEFLKIPYIVILAKLFENGEKKAFKNGEIILNTAPIYFLFVFLIIMQGDLGTVIHYTSILFFMLFLSKISKKIVAGFIGLASVSLISGLGYVHYFINDTQGVGYRVKRIKSYLDGLLQGKYGNDVGYQVGQSLIAMGSGGIFGKGYANGVQKYSYLPEIHTDFILASLGEEWGFAGVLLIMILFYTIFSLSMTIAAESRDYFAKYLVAGMASLIFTQLLINSFVVTGLMPVTGIPFPIFSYGGSSLITVFAALGIVLNVNKKNLIEKYGAY
ncbi:putative peptidoglycan glycosyltransferase FtsW [uncultured Ilyobacter sp.]|uniref:FtsW/RodA/SpoVE family cell cycle protein n=1 Tax=uncultured Ilyobacter sp. TaxID=544433 RepID=UPI002AA6FE4C|nr:putative peptidoglycan glycosyltransferase FtsW [uncultured Ilyobacter sp.]